jgi:hypothetical protein
VKECLLMGSRTRIVPISPVHLEWRVLSTYDRTSGKNTPESRDSI